MPTFIFVDPINAQFPGFLVIIRHAQKSLQDAVVIHSLEGRNETDIILALGIVASKQLMESGLPKRVSFLIDSSILGFASVCKFYLRRRDVLSRELYIDFLRYLKYYPIELAILRSFQTVIVVSPHDGSYLQHRFELSNVRVIPNGVSLPIIPQTAAKDFDYTLGILSYWGKGTYHDVSWFIRDFLPQLRERFPGLRLVTAGRGADEEMIRYLRRNKVEHIGEIERLEDFFDRIDIVITTLRKECGILNKVLDAFAHKKIVLGLRHNMYAFNELKGGFFTYDTLEEMAERINFIHNNPSIVDQMTERAFAYAREQHDWTTNYRQLKEIVSYVQSAISPTRR
jgi:glycosyltransferase involved in cell wall biosynthesis